MHPAVKQRILRKLEADYCVARKEIAAAHGATTDNALIEFVVANDRVIRAENRKEIIAVIDEWAGYDPSSNKEHPPMSQNQQPASTFQPLTPPEVPPVTFSDTELAAFTRQRDSTAR